ncbi:MAG: hypothetical protein QM483_13510 [Desulfuromusa sp.]
MRHRILRSDKLCAILDLDGAWLNLKTRHIAPPPKQLVEKFEVLERTEEFRVIVSGKGS